MTRACPANPTGGGSRNAEGGAAALGIAKWLSLAAAPTFAIMALLTLAGPPNMICSAGDGSPLAGMVPMYLLMSAFHLAPWLKLIPNRRGNASRLKISRHDQDSIDAWRR